MTRSKSWPDDQAAAVLPVARPPFAEPVPSIERLVLRQTPFFFLSLGTVCNLACRYCYYPADTPSATPTPQLEALVDRMAAHGFRKVSLYGGEPTVHRGFTSIVDRIRKAGFDVVRLTTNGVALARPGFVDEVASHGVTDVHFSLDDFDEAALGAMLGVEGAPRAVLAGLGAVLGHPRLNVVLYAVVTRANVGHLQAYVTRVRELSERRGRRIDVLLAAFKPTGAGREHSEALLAPMQEVASSVAEAVRLGTRIGVDVAYRHLPPCLMPGLEAWLLDAYVRETRIDLETGEEVRGWAPHWVAKGPDCTRCVWSPHCEGVHQSLVAVAGWRELRPVARADALSGSPPSDPRGARSGD